MSGDEDQPNAGQEAADGEGEVLQDLVRAELRAARKSPEGLSANSMTCFPAMRDLLGDGDPLIAFQRLQHRILETLDTNDDVKALEAAAYSLGVASAETTHLARMEDFGTEYGYEVRQVRRYSDRGIEQLVRLITSNWVVHTVPTLEVFMAQQSAGSFTVSLRTTRQRFISMQDVRAYEQTGDGPRRERSTSLRADGAGSGPDAATSAARISETTEPFTLKAAEPGTPRHLRFVWEGEVWPRFVMNFVGKVADGQVVTSQTLGNVMQVSVEALGLFAQPGS